MTTRASPRLIGAFVIGGLLLTALGVVLFGSGRWFKETVTVVMYFDGSVNGLDVGAPVKLRGVTVGSVTHIQLVFKEEQRNLFIRVFAELDPTQIYTRRGALTRVTHADREEALRKACRQYGLYGRLETQSLLTGKLFIELNADPTIAARFVHPKDLDAEVVEIPTVPSTSEQVMQVIQKAAEHLGELPIGEMLDDIRESLAAIRRIVNSPDIPQTLHSVRAASARLDKVLDALETHTEPLLVSVRRAAEQTTTLAETLERETPPTAQALREASEAVGALARHTDPRLQGLLRRLEGLAEEATGMAHRVDALLREGSPMTTAWIQALEEVQRAARALRGFAEYLDRHPEALLRGKR